MARLHSVKQKNNVRGTYLQRNNFIDQVKDVAYLYFFPEIS